MKLSKIGKNIGMTLVLPVVVYLFFLILCSATGHSGFGVGNDLTTIIYNAVFAGLVAQAMAINVTTGRFDFAIGANLVLSTILGGNIALSLGWGPLGLLLFVTIIATVVGLISGLVYVILKLPPMVVSVGLAMVYEAIGFMFNNAKGVKMIGNKMLVFARTGNSLILMAVVLILLVIVYDFTKIGYNRRALQGGQKIAVDVGIREKNNAVYCYVIAGVMMGLAGCVYLSKNGVLAPETGLGSSSYFMSAFLPMFIGGIFAKYSSYPVAIFMGAVVQAMITSGLQRMGVSNSVQTVINGLIVCAFLIYASNSYKLVEAQMFKEKLAKAKAARESAKT